MNRRTLFCLVLIAILGLGLGQAAAQPIPPRVWLGPLVAPDVPGASLIAKKFDEALRVELRKAKTYRLVGPGEPSQRFEAGRTDPLVVEAENMRAAGRTALTNMDLGAAYVALKGALERYEMALPSLAKPEVLVTTLSLLGATALADGAKKEADEWFRRAATIWPEADVDGLDGEAVVALKGHQQDVLRFRKGRLRVTTTPSGAAIRVNGVEVGTSPVTVKAMAEGIHYVQASHESEGLAAGKVTVKRRRGKLELSLQKELGPADAISPPVSVQDFLWKWNPRLTALDMPTNGAMIAAKTTTGAHYIILQRLVTTDSPDKMTLEVRVIAPDKRRIAMLYSIPLGTNLSGVYVGATKLAKGVAKAVDGLGRVDAAPLPKKPKKKRRRRRR